MENYSTAKKVWRWLHNFDPTQQIKPVDIAVLFYLRRTNPHAQGHGFWTINHLAEQLDGLSTEMRGSKQYGYIQQRIYKFLIPCKLVEARGYNEMGGIATKRELEAMHGNRVYVQILKRGQHYMNDLDFFMRHTNKKIEDEQERRKNGATKTVALMII